MEKINKDGFFAAAKANRILVVDVYADWCGPCKMMAPVLEEIAAELEGKVAFVKMDADVEKDFIQSYNIMSIPTLLFFKDEELVGKLTGFVPKNKVLQLLAQIS